MKEESTEDIRDSRELPYERAARLAGSLALQAAQLGDLAPIDRARAIETLAASARSVMAALAATRREALVEARERGMALAQIGGELGISAQAVSKAIKNRPG